MQTPARLHRRIDKRKTLLINSGDAHKAVTNTRRICACGAALHQLYMHASDCYKLLVGVAFAQHSVNQSIHIPFILSLIYIYCVALQPCIGIKKDFHFHSQCNIDDLLFMHGQSVERLHSCLQTSKIICEICLFIEHTYGRCVNVSISLYKG